MVVSSRLKVRFRRFRFRDRVRGMRPVDLRVAAIKSTWQRLSGLPATALHRMHTELLCTQP